MLDTHNVHAKSFRMARDRYKHKPFDDLKLRLIADRTKDGRIYNIPTVAEVAALIVGDVDSASPRDIIMENRSGKLQRINELHTSYLGFQYPLLFPYGEDGYRQDVIHRETLPSRASKRNRLTIREWFCFRIQTRQIEASTILRSRRLFQQFVVDGYTMIESKRLSFIRNNQSKLRVDKYNNLSDRSSNSEKEGASKGKRIVLPSSFVGGRRFMDQLYFDGMAICSYLGFLDLFVTFTCNPKWPEITRLLSDLSLAASDRPNIVSRIFRIKFEQLLEDLTKKDLLGRAVGCRYHDCVFIELLLQFIIDYDNNKYYFFSFADMYTIEFQKRGLPHAHLLLFLHPTSKYPTATDIDKVISAEIPCPVMNTLLYNCVKDHMIHGPCGIAKKSSPCMKNGVCSRFYPKKFQPMTVIDEDGFAHYKRRDNGVSVTKNDISLDNRYVVPYNPKLLLKYQAHINVEW